MIGIDDCKTVGSHVTLCVSCKVVILPTGNRMIRCRECQKSHTRSLNTALQGRRRESKRPLVNCEICGKEFKRWGTRKFCSDLCYQIDASRRGAERAKTDKGKRSNKDFLLRRHYGITLNQRDELLKSQGNVCAICKKGFIKERHKHVDHDHLTGKIRGILCHGCNIGIGGFKESQSAMLAAVEYLLKNKCQ